MQATSNASTAARWYRTNANDVVFGTFPRRTARRLAPFALSVATETATARIFTKQSATRSGGLRSTEKKKALHSAFTLALIKKDGI